MEIIKNNTGELEATIVVKIENQDYAEQYEAELKKVRKVANIKGFRPGKVPMGVVKKMYGREIRFQEVQKYLDSLLKKYFDENNINLVGEPLPSKTEKTKFDFDNSGSFQFAFDIGFFSDFDIKLEELNVPYYSIFVREEDVDKEIELILERNSTLEQVEEVSEKSNIRVKIVELDENNNLKEDGLVVENGLIFVKYLAEETQKQLKGAKKEDTFDIDKKTFLNETDLTYLLNVSKDELPKFNNFNITINTIEEHKKAVLGQELYDSIFGEDKVKNEDEMREEVSKMLEDKYAEQVDDRLVFDIKNALKENVNISIPEEFIVRWRLEVSEEKEENVRENLGKIKEIIVWNRVIDYLADKYDVEITEDDIYEVARAEVVNKIAQLGLSASVFDEEQLNIFAGEELAKMTDIERDYFSFSVLEGKTLRRLFNEVNKEEKKINIDEFYSIYEEENKKIAEQQQKEEINNEEVIEEEKVEEINNEEVIEEEKVEEINNEEVIEEEKIEIENETEETETPKNENNEA